MQGEARTRGEAAGTAEGFQSPLSLLFFLLWGIILPRLQMFAFMTSGPMYMSEKGIRKSCKSSHAAGGTFPPAEPRTWRPLVLLR